MIRGASRTNATAIQVKLPEAWLRKISSGASGESAKRFMYELAMSVRSYWKTLAGQKLRASRNLYVRSIVAEQGASALSWDVFLNDVTAQRIETGKDKFDMKTGLLKNPRMTKDGKPYKFVPLNVNRVVDFNPRSSTTKWVTLTPDSAGWMWGDYRTHPAGPNKVGVKLSKDVIAYTNTVLIPERVKALIEGIKP